MAAKRGVEHEIVLRYSDQCYWLTVVPAHPAFADEYIFSRVDLYRRAIAVMEKLPQAVCRDESAATPDNMNRTRKFFASLQPWANNEYVPSIVNAEPSFFDARAVNEVAEPSFFDAHLLPG